MMKLGVKFLLLVGLASISLAFAEPQAESWLNAPQRRTLQSLETPAAQAPQVLPESFSSFNKDGFSRDALQFFAARSVFQEGAEAELSQPITQAEWLTLLYEAIGDKPWFVNDEPYYPDVPVAHWAFTAFEAFRLKQWIPLEGGEASGKMSPDALLTQRQALLTLGRTLREEPYSWVDAEQLLQEYQLDVSVMKLEDMEALSHVLAAGFWPILIPASQQKDIDLSSPMTRLDAVRLAYQRYLLTQQKLAVLTDSDKRLPAGLILTISPTTVVFLNRLEVGGPSYFFLKEALDVPSLALFVPAGSRVFARVRGVSLEENKPPVAKLMIEQVVLPTGEKYTVNANLVLVFPQKEPRWFLPTARFETVTKQVERLIVKP